jgi:hypothetical protein
MIVSTSNNSISPIISSGQISRGITSQGTTASSTTRANVYSDADTVQLSATAQASAMHDQGFSVQEIAYSLGVTSQVVDGYLGIATSVSQDAAGGGTGPTTAAASTAKASHAVAGWGSGSSSSSTESSTKAGTATTTAQANTNKVTPVKVSPTN